MSKIINALLLAGGKSSRMNGQEKALLDYQGKPMIEHIIEQLPQELISKIIISCNRNQESFARYEAELIDDSGYSKIPAFSGPLLGILTALEKYPCDHLLVLPCDTPNITKDLLSSLIQKHLKSDTNLSCCSLENRLQPLHSVWKGALKDDLYRYLLEGNRRAQEFVSGQTPLLFDCTSQAKQLKNINYPQELL